MKNVVALKSNGKAGTLRKTELLAKRIISQREPLTPFVSFFENNRFMV